jgi:hypothetical protein
MTKTHARNELKNRHGLEFFSFYGAAPHNFVCGNSLKEGQERLFTVFLKVHGSRCDRNGTERHPDLANRHGRRTAGIFDQNSRLYGLRQHLSNATAEASDSPP